MINRKTKMEKSMKLIYVILVSSTLFYFSGCGTSKKPDSEKPVIFVKTAPVKQEMISFPVNTSGILASPKEMKLSFKVGGIIQKIQVDDGDRVQKGQLLASLEKSEIEAMAQRARSGYEKALRDFERVSSLYQDSVATLEQKQDTETALQVAKSNLEIADFNLKHSSIFAPSEGKIIKRLAENNELIETGTPVFIFGSTEGAWIIRTGVSDRDVVRLQYGDSAVVSFDAYPGESFYAEVTEISQSADPYTGTFEIELTLDQQGKNLVFGFVADIHIFPRAGRQYYVIPIEALAEANAKTGTVFYVNKQNTAGKTTVQIADVFDDQIAIQSGLEGITTVVTDGSAYLRDGATVQIKTESSDNR
jgi:RND family efflux transporter MFP subunit